MKLLRVLVILLAITLFAGCEVWISFWGAADGERDLLVQADISSITTVASDRYVRAFLYERQGSSYSFVASIQAPVGSTTLNGGFLNLPSGTYKVSIWYDADNDVQPDFAGLGPSSELGVTVGSVDLSSFVDYTVYVATSQDWYQDGDQYVHAP